MFCYLALQLFISKILPLFFELLLGCFSIMLAIFLNSLVSLSIILEMNKPFT